MSTDSSNIHPVPIQKTLLLINNFVLNSTTFLNNFSDACEKKLSKVSYKLSELEIILAVFEAKLDSIPGLESTTSSSAPVSAVAETASVAPAAVAATATGTTIPVVGTPAPIAEPVAAPVNTGLIAVKDHPDYKPFAKLIKVGVPLQVAKNKLLAAGLNLNADYLDNVDQLISSEAATSTLLVVSGDGGNID